MRALFIVLSVFFLSQAAMAQAPSWEVDMARSRLGFEFSQEGKLQEGHFSRFAAKIAFDPQAPEQAHVEVLVDLTSVAAGSQDANDALLGGDWFNTRKFPEARFVSRAVTRAADGGYRMDADLTIRDRTVRVVLPFTLAIAGDGAHARGALSLDRLAFGLGEGIWANPKFIGLAVTVRIDLFATLKPALP
ncbi:MAG: YceI family protein [Pseudomonadota bacterium]